MPDAATLERIIRIEQGYDCREQGGGVHGAQLRMVLKGQEGAVQFLLFTHWFPPTVPFDEPADPRFRHLFCRPIPADLGYYSRTPRFAGQNVGPNCEFLGGAPCYYDGSSLAAERIFDILRTGGSDGAWAALEQYYREIFGPRPEIVHGPWPDA